MALTSDELMATVEGQTVASLFLDTVAEHGDRVALRWKDDHDDWHELTYAAYAERVARAVAGFRAMGLAAGDRVVLMMRNIPEFHVLDLAVCFCGATPVSIYNSSSPDQVQYLVDHCGASIGIVEDLGFLERFMKVRSEMPTLDRLLIIRDPEQLAPDDVFDYQHLMDHEPADLAEAATSCAPDQLLTLIYTSGTTGPPKAVMLTHRNAAWTVESLRLSMEWTRDDMLGFRVVSYLPMAHIAERATSYYAAVASGYEVTCCPEPSQVADYAREVRPNLMFGVPRVWEKFYAAVQAAIAADPEKAKQFADALATAGPIALDMAWGRETDEQRATWEFLDEVAFKGVRQLIGLDDCRIAISGAAPIPQEVLVWYRAIGVPMAEIYGMSESSGPMTLAARRIKPGSVGPAIPGCEVRLADDGEIVCRGGNVFAGYYKDPDKTAEALDAEGWLHSGDIGTVDGDGYFTVIDRKKELIITAGGKNISPANLEAALKTIPLIGQAAAIGDNRPFVAALVVLDPDVAPVWARAQGIEFESLHDLARDQRVIDEVERGLAEVMAPFNNAERVKKVTILGEEWLPDTDVLTPTSKLKRRGILARYDDVIEALYS